MLETPIMPEWFRTDIDLLIEKRISLTVFMAGVRELRESNPEAYADFTKNVDDLWRGIFNPSEEERGITE